MNLCFRRISLLLVVLLACAAAGFGQSTGTIQGTVLDSSGAPVPNAMVTVHDESTGQERTLNTDSAGIYSAPSLPVGTYRVEVKAAGMAPMAAPGLILSVGSTVRQDFSLMVAAATAV